MGLFEFLKKNKTEQNTNQCDISAPSTETQSTDTINPSDKSDIDDIKLEKVLVGVDKYCPPKPVVKFTVKKEETTVFDSKIGGVPYFPKDMEYPYGKAGGYKDQPLVMLAQLNFATLPNIPNFPTEGILQLYIASDCLYGMSETRNRLNVQDNFRIIYHREITDDLSHLMTLEDIPKYNGTDYCYLPFKGEYKLIPRAVEYMSVNSTDFEFGDAFVRSYNELHDVHIIHVWDLSDEIYYQLSDMDQFPQAIMGGYPMFVQDDPRDGTGYEKYDTVLFELDSIYDESQGIEISWGDGGTGTFLISREDLLSCDFSSVLYNYDCL